MLATDDGILAQLNIVSRKLQMQLNNELMPLQLTASNYYFLLKLNLVGQMTQDQLFHQIYLSPSNVTRRLDELIRLGLVKKTRATDDKRSWNISLTNKGTRLIPALKHVLAHINQESLGALSSAQVDAFTESLVQIAVSLT
ncbi:MarR family winged helix-turn-helix transcriptional regulator [Furfurilactobacillus milii]|uniref:MarR family winged helix-turn-helix transcriptional regulator n=1 Tax=Furfurilactobacillus milii TaxID=2888272 RepID=UPI001EEE71E0|nr:MarR family transcriptional regulator [Furfurilactobacillus milii]MCF6418429.1 MarR family transcriptional regulator [Furfurilactobacillus milii]